MNEDLELRMMRLIHGLMSRINTHMLKLAPEARTRVRNWAVDLFKTLPVAETEETTEEPDDNDGQNSSTSAGA